MDPYEEIDARLRVKADALDEQVARGEISQRDAARQLAEELTRLWALAREKHEHRN